jgi:hypothetical protein
MNEEEAKTKWCPMARVQSAETGPAYNVRDNGLFINEIKCIASDCMMWREIDAIKGGYCGLAGKSGIE